MQFIMLGGKAGVGKTFLARHIAKYAFNKGMRPHIVSFADCIKQEAENAGFTKDKEPEKYREFCQSMGKKHRAEDPDYFVKKFNDTFMGLWDEESYLLKQGNQFWETLVIVDDCRYLNEIAYGRFNNAIQIFIGTGDRELRDNDGEWRNDLSEEVAMKIEEGDKDYLNLYSWVVLNDKTWEEFKKKVKEYLPVWCGMDADSCGEIDCNCAFCKTMKDGQPLEGILKEIYEEMIKYLDEMIEGDEDEET